MISQGGTADDELNFVIGTNFIWEGVREGTSFFFRGARASDSYFVLVSFSLSDNDFLIRP